MARLVRSIPREPREPSTRRTEPAREWLVTNGLGGYASGTITGHATRRYHGLLIAALPAPLGRWLLLSHLSERVRLASGQIVELGGGLPGGAGTVRAGTEFRLEDGLPIWEYSMGGTTIEKRVLMGHTQNTTYILYRLVDGGAAVRLKLMPAVHSRSHDAPVTAPLPAPFRLSEHDGHYEIAASDLPPLG